MIKVINSIGKVIFEVCSAGLVVGGAILIYEKIFVTGYQIGGILENVKKAKQAVKAVNGNG